MEKTNRSEAATKAAATRKANKLEMLRMDQEQQERREWLYVNTVSDKQRAEIEEVLSEPFACLDDTYEEAITVWYDERCEEVADAIRSLLRKGVTAKTILAAIEQEDFSFKFDLGIYSLAVDAKEILKDVLLEEEFLGNLQPTPELKDKMWTLTDTFVSKKEVATEAVTA